MEKKQIIVLEKGVKTTVGPMGTCCAILFIPFRS